MTKRLDKAASSVLMALALVAMPVAAAAAPTARAENLTLTTAVRTALVDAGASHYGLGSSAFTGLGQGTAYYAYDLSTSTYWAGASLVPSPKSYEAGVVVQDDGAYLIFDRPAHGAWQARDVGYSDSVGDCAAYHVSIPSAVVAVWHWAPGTCHPPANLSSTGSGSSAKSQDHDYALAVLQWERGAQAGPADYHHYWVAAAADLTKAVAAHLPGSSGYPRAASELLKLVHLPFVVNTPVQMQAGAAVEFEALNSFFSTDGLYGVNAPSANPAAFVATLQLEARSGTIQVVADPFIGTAPNNYPDATLTCPVLSPLAFKAVALSPLSYNATFGCKLTTSSIGTYYIVGVISAAHATGYAGTITGLGNNGTPVFTCNEFFDSAQLQVAKKLGALCK
jgi:hypothetical protein